jgi:AcrR family transcriptional regulator
MKARQGQKSREKIIKAAIKIFGKKGYDQTSIQHIADKCGVSQTNIFYHFKSKKQLFEQIIHFVIKNNRSLFSQMSDVQDEPRKRLYKLTLANLVWANKYPEQCQLMLLLFYFAATHSKLKDLSMEVLENGRDLVESLVQEIATTESQQWDCRKHAIFIQQYINGIQFQMMARNDAQLMLRDFELNGEKTLNRLLA